MTRRLIIALVAAMVSCREPPQDATGRPAGSGGDDQHEAGGVAGHLGELSLITIAENAAARVLFRLFAAMETVTGSRAVRRSPSPKPLPTKPGSQGPLPTGFMFKGTTRDTQSFLRRTGTGSMLVIKDGEIVHESYYLGADRATRFASWSVAKSFTSALVGAAIEDGFIGSVDDLATKYVPELAGTAYERAKIIDILTMSSGVEYDEDYANPFSDVYGLFTSLLADSKKHVLSYRTSKTPPGERNSYRSVDTMVLGVILQAAIGQPIASYLERTLWHPLGAEYDAAWLVDRQGLEATFCCLKATTRDYAKLGLLYLNRGEVEGHQVLPAAWIDRSLDFSAGRLQFGENALSDDPWGYGYQWWMPTPKTFSAIGVFNQFVYVDPIKRVVIAKNSANPTYLARDAEDEHVAFFHAIIEAL